MTVAAAAPGGLSATNALLKFKTDWIQGTHAIPLYFFILFPTAVATPGKGSIVMQFQSYPDSRI